MSLGRSVAVARRRCGVRFLCCGAEEVLRKERVRGAGALVARLLGDPSLTFGVGRVLSEVKKHGRYSKVSE